MNEVIVTDNDRERITITEDGKRFALRSETKGAFPDHKATNVIEFDIGMAGSIVAFLCLGKMKCPRVYRLTIHGLMSMEKITAECIKEECAWWDDGQCNELNKTMELHLIRETLQEIRDRLPVLRR